MVAHLDADVVVVGYGPVGALAALLLARAGVRVVVIDRHREIYPLPRAVAADGEVLQLLAHAGLHDTVVRMRAAHGARFAGPMGAALLDVDLVGADGGPGLALYRQPDLEFDLRAAVADCPGVQLLLGRTADGVRQDADGVLLRLDDGGTLRARYLIGCDGARSSIREMLGIPLLGPAQGRSWLVIDSLGAPPAWVHPHRVTYLCDARRPAVAMRTPAGWRLEALLAEDLPGGPLDAETARRLAGGRLSVVDGGSIERAAVYRFATRTAARWRSGRVLLAGDAAHTMPPFAGQGLAAGLRDIHNLAWKLALVVHGTADEGLLDSYQRERLPHLRQMTGLTALVGALVTAPPALAPARDAGLRLAATRLGRRAIRQVSRPRPLLPSSAWPGLPGSVARGGQLLAASTLPAGWVTLVGRECEPDPVSHLDPRARSLWLAVGGRSVTVSAEEDLSGLLGPGQVLMVRPDAVVAGVFPADLLSGAVVTLLEGCGCVQRPGRRAAPLKAPGWPRRSLRSPAVRVR